MNVDILKISWISFEIEESNRLPFLDVDVGKCGGRLTSRVHVKATSSGDCLNFNSVAPYRYKVGVIRTMLHRAYMVCSDYESLHLEFNRIKTLLNNNNFPMKTIESEINKFMTTKMNNNNNAQITPPINLYYKNQMCTQYKQEEENIKKIISDNIRSTEDRKVQLTIYYKSRKLSNLFIKNNPHKNNQQSRVVYQYTCSEIKDGCSPTTPSVYIGYTTTLVKQRMIMHAQTGSIRNHHENIHKHKITNPEIMDSIEIKHKSHDRLELQIAEALLIKSEKPNINNQAEGEARILKIF